MLCGFAEVRGNFPDKGVATVEEARVSAQCSAAAMLCYATGLLMHGPVYCFSFARSTLRGAQGHLQLQNQGFPTCPFSCPV